MKLSLAARALIQLIVGLALLFGALIMDLGTAGTLITFAAGATLTGLGLGSGDTLPLATLSSLDNLLATVLAAASIGLALTGDATAAVMLLAVAVAQVVLTNTTRWTRPASTRI